MFLFSRERIFRETGEKLIFLSLKQRFKLSLLKAKRRSSNGGRNFSSFTCNWRGKNQENLLPYVAHLFVNWQLNVTKHPWIIAFFTQLHPLSH